MKRRYSDNDVKVAVEQNKSIAGVLRQLGLSPLGGNYKTVHQLIKKLNLDTSHFTGQGWNVGLAFKPKTAFCDEDIFVEHSSYLCSWRLRERYKRKTGLHHCENCGLTTWLGRDVPLEIHHINGNNTDNRIENLQLLCPNCHALTSNYRGRAQLSARAERSDV